MGLEFWYIARCLKTVCSGLKSPIFQGQFQCYSISVAVTKYNSEEIPDVQCCCYIHWCSGAPPPLKDPCLGLFLENEELEWNGCLLLITNKKSGLYASTSFSYTETDSPQKYPFIMSQCPEPRFGVSSPKTSYKLVCDIEQVTNSLVPFSSVKIGECTHLTRLFWELNNK